MAPGEIFLTIVVVLIMGVGLASVLLEYFEDDDRHLDRYRRLRDKIMSPKNQKQFFKRIHWFKKLLRNKNVHAHIADDIVWVRKVQVEGQYNSSFDVDKKLKDLPLRVQTNEMWKLADQRQLFSAKELKVIDKVNAAIEKEVGEKVAAFERAKAAQAEREARAAEQKAREEAEARARAQRVAEKSQKLKNARENKSKSACHKPCQKKASHYVCKISFGE